MTECQKICLEVYKFFKDICEKNGLMYFAVGGTCIGAVRHNGFIPWDDDIDIAMPYNDFRRFARIAYNELGKDYELRTPFDNNNRDSNLVLRLFKVKTAYIPAFNVPFPYSYKGIGVDILPVVGLPKGPKQKVAVFQNDLYVKLDEKFKYRFIQEKALRSKIIWIICAPFKIILYPNYWTSRIIKNFGSIPLDHSNKIMFAWRKKRRKGDRYYDSVFDYEDFKSCIEVSFEDTTMRVPIGYDNYLSHEFGDYMTLPPVEERISNHDLAVLDTKHSYKDYIGKL